MARYNYEKYKILIDPGSKKTQGLKAGDVVRRQYFDSPNLIYSLMIVLETGIDIIGEKESSYFIGALIEGDVPKNGELLDFVRITNLHDTDRSGALYLTASDPESPYMDVIDGLAYENSLCYPYMPGGKTDYPDKNKYSCTGKAFLDTEYKKSDTEADRIFRISRNNLSNPTGILGIQQTIEKELSHPQRLIVSFKGRASKKMTGIPVFFGYTDDPEQVDGKQVIDIDTHWQYNLFMVTIDLPSHYQRSFYIDLTKELSNTGNWFEVADLNIVLQSDVSVFSNATKARVGKIKGIIDPVFGVLDGYGAYFQNIYATRNVNIAGTLTAGDENGFSSTFYVGKIHKNVILNSIDCELEGDNISVVEEHTPVGIGKVWKTDSEVKLKIQTPQWRNEHTEQKYVFSLWIKEKTNEQFTVSVFQDEHPIKDLNIISSEEWQRYYVVVVIKESESTGFSIRLVSSVSGILITAPQFEPGIVPSQYQPTDGTLAYVEDYGAWFSKGGIGGTIQNPLLRLNNDGSISSRDNSFVINPDGTGYFASGRFKWTKDTITLQDVTIRWEDLSNETREQAYPVLVDIVSNSGFTVKNNSNDIDARAIIYRNAKELDKAGTEYTYTWKLWNADRTSLVKTYTGKTITIAKEDVVEKGVLMCEVSK
jgi:hypothetical protein